MRGRKPEISADPDALTATTKPPLWLSAPAKREWKKVLPFLIERRVLTEADLASFANYCAAVGQAIEAQRIISKEGITYTAPNGLSKQNAAVGVMQKAIVISRQLAAELGLTPASRSRPAIRDDDAEDLSFLD
jgi:P27 family predicted phage terminase small subunit